MNDKINKGYIITDSVHVGDTEFVLGVSMHEPNQFVTWECKERSIIGDTILIIR